jgi:hypothetical protein
MRFQMNKNLWKVRGALAVAALALLATSALADDSSITYPVKRMVIGTVMSVLLPADKGRDGEIMVSEKTYQVSSRTVMVDENERKTQLDHFKLGNWVYMIVDLYRDHREVMFIGPSTDPSSGSDPYRQEKP